MGFHSFIPRTLHGKFLAIYFPSASILAFVFLALFEWQAYQSALRDLRQNLHHTLGIQSTVLAQATWDLDGESIQSILAVLPSYSDFVGVVVHDASGDQLGALGEMPSAAPWAVSAQQAIVYDAGQGAQSIGTIQLAFTNQNVRAHTIKRLFLSVGLTFALLIAVVISVYFTNHYLVGIPLKLLLTSIELAEEHQQLQPVQWQSRDEMGTVITAFNNMQDQQQHIETSLQEAYDTLERRVEERTVELEERTVELGHALNGAEAANQAKSDFLGTFTTFSKELPAAVNARFKLRNACSPCAANPPWTTSPSSS